MGESTPPLDALSAAEAGQRYLYAVNLTDTQLTALHQTLSLDTHVMNVLCLLYLDLGTDMVRERTDPMAVYQCREYGWVVGDGRLQLTSEGLAAWWQWKNAVTPHRRDSRFQQLWRDVTGW
ncbi:hypothetical protein SAMN04488074_108226 [Lentzea albidocapillata subsp. violacea]|uniref:Uncharacterized protein n=1 Tax=Lentzea albidocapillata subsp. violacea TaxID=128104 RepID=A0A1G9GIS6_9PSEU|nr:hypothetical protein [Lentzea albidocapillata]SDL00588.1 hypothetical protein SAMN04488074_108226 [Lentzea albidocapillata subsp. violacea]